MKTVVAGIALLAAVANAANQMVMVAPSGNLVFSPSSVTANPGDTVEFVFESNNHSVAESSFSSPCTPLAGGIWSGFVLTTGTENAAAATTTTSSNSGSGSFGYKRQNNAPTFTVTVNDTNPAFFYCAQIGHCQLGMVFAINPSSNETVSAYQSAAKNANTVVPNEAVTGGILSTSGSSSPSTSTSPSASQTPTSGAAGNAINFMLLIGALMALLI